MTKSTERNIVLKSIHNDIMTDNPDATLTTKQMRAKLRVARREAHVKNTSWVFTSDEADDVRAMFDDDFRAKLERRRKRNNRKTTTKKSKSTTATETADAE